jgi:hypothetical protein
VKGAAEYACVGLDQSDLSIVADWTAIDANPEHPHAINR